MKKLVLFILASCAWATDPSINYERWHQWGSQTVFPGYTLLFNAWPEYSVTFSCSSTDNTCFSAAFTPNGSEQFLPSDVGLTATGLQTQVYQTSAPIYVPVNIGTNGNAAGHFNLQMHVINNGLPFNYSNYLSSAGTSSTPVSSCADGKYPADGNPNLSYGLTFMQAGAVRNARYQVTVASGLITAASMIDGGGNFSTPPTTGTLVCTDSGGGNHTYSTVFSGGTLRTFIPITGTGSVTMFLRSCAPCQGVAAGNPYLKDVHGTGWPTGTTMKYWTTDSGGNILYPAPGIPAMSCSPASNCIVRLSNLILIEVTIPTNASPGTITAGWTFCTDSAATLGCVDMTKTITVEQVPTYALSPPTNPPALPALFTSPTPVKCLNSLGGSALASGDCRFNTLLTSTTENGWGHFWPFRSATAPNTPDLELHSPGQYMQFTDAGSFCSQPLCNWFYDWGGTQEKIYQWTNDSSWLNSARAILARFGNTGPGVAGIGKAAAGSLDFDAPMRPYNVQAFSPFTVSREYNVGGSRAVANNLPYFNGGNYSNASIPPLRWSAEMAATLIAAAQTAGVVNTVAGVRLPNAIPGQTTLGSAATGVIGYGTPGNSGIRYSSFQFDTQLELVRTLGFPLWQWDAVHGVNVPTLVGQSYFLAREILWTQALQFVNPAASGPYDQGPSGDQYWQIGGFFLRSLIHDYEFSHEPLDLFAIKSTLDYLKAFYVGAPTYYFPITTAPKGVNCIGSADNEPNVGWYINTTTLVPCSDDPLTYSSGYAPLAGIMSYPYAWWGHRYSGSDNTYLNFADTMAVNGLGVDVTAGWRFTAKANGEEFGWAGFDYFAERQLRQSSPR